MSWFDAGALANIAKSALKEAQKTIDKALDIKEEIDGATPLNTPVDTNSDDFFGAWGISQSGQFGGPRRQSSDESSRQNKLTSSLWGSFTGSFFDNSKDVKSNSAESLDDSVDFSKSKLVVQNSEEDDGIKSGDNLVEVDLNASVAKPSISNINRLSVVSPESGKNSSDSVDVLTECTTTPESDIVSTPSSAGGLKQTSESVEVLGDSLTSPSSVEILDPESNNSRDDFVSPLDSPHVADKLSTPGEVLSPDSVEVIPEDDADDTMSYTSISESTSATILDSAFNILAKPQKMLKDTYNRTEIPENDDPSPVSEAITRAPSRSVMHLPLTQINQVLIDTQPQSSNKQDLPMILEKTNIIDFPIEDRSEAQLDLSVDDGSQSDRTIIESQESAMESSSETTSTTTDVSNTSTYLKKMLADAMVEKSGDEYVDDCQDKASSIESIGMSQIELIPRETSPLSSERSDLVKVGSDHTSCHTSCDELETTTSSDIEIISSPNGDSSSTRSRQSPAKQNLGKPKCDDSLLHKMGVKKVKGHNRELSEASSISDDSHPNGEIDRLLKRISEMTEILESRESKLIDMTRRNAELQGDNSDLKKQLDCVLTQQLKSPDVSQVTEEYTQRLAALEKKFQQAIREKDTLKKQLEQAKLEAAARPSKGELESTMASKDQLIKELREEGEKLSKQQLQHSNIIKKLRAKEKEQESTIKHLKESNESLSLETDRLKKSLAAKDEVERSQIEAVHQLTNKNKKLDGEVSKLKSQLDDLTQKYETARKSLDAAKKELIEKSRAASELQAREQLLQSLESQKKMTESQNEEVLSQLDDLRYKLRLSEEEYVQKEHKLRLENGDLLRRLEEAEARNEELSQSILEVSKPLVRQLESLQAMHNSKVAQFEKIEQDLTLQINDLKSKLQTYTSLERSTKEECVSLRAKLADLEGQLSNAKHELELTRVQLEQQKTQHELTVQELKREINSLRDLNKKQKENVEHKSKEIETLKQQISSFEVEKKRTISQDLSVERNDPTPDRTSSEAGSNSPTLSLGKSSIPESVNSLFWSQDEPFEASHAPRYTNMFEMQMLQSGLKQREGEVQQLQWELNRREQERSLLNSEISTLLTRVEDLESTVEKYEEIKVQFADLQRQYDTLCQLYGEKVEENEELKLDLTDVKEMYKSQIDELLKQQKQKR